MTTEHRKVLSMLSAGKLTPEEAEGLLEALEAGIETNPTDQRPQDWLDLNAPPPARTATFPEDFSMGTLYVRDWDVNNPPTPCREDPLSWNDPLCWDDDNYLNHAVQKWSRLATARGAVKVPAGQELALVISGNGKHNYDALSQLAPSGLQGLAAEDVDNDDFGAITRLTGLNYLTVRKSPELGDVGLARLEKLSSLRALGLAGIDKIDTGFAALEQLTSLRQLELVEISMTERAIVAMGRIPALDYFAAFDMSFTDFDVIAHLKFLPVPGLVFQDCDNLTDATLAHLATLHRNAGMPLKHLNTGSWKISDGAIEHLFSAVPKEQIEAFWPAFSSLTEDVLQTIKEMPNIRTLGLGNLPITDAGIELLESLTKLEAIELIKTRITDRSVDSLSKLKNLKHLRIWDTGISKSGVARLRKALPACEVFDRGWY